MVALTTLPNTAPLEEVVAVVERDGGVIVEGLFSGELLEALQRDVESALNTTPFGVDPDFAGTLTQRSGAMFARSDHMAEVATHPTYVGIANALLRKPITVFAGEHPVPITPGVQVGLTQAIRIAPGQGAQVLHRDDAVWLWRHNGDGREARVQIMVAISDFTAENGGTRVIPGSHRWDDERAPKLEESVSTEMTAGSALFWVGSVYHGGGQNTSSEPRTGLTMSLDLSFLRQEENHYLSIPLERVKSFPPDVQQLLGWAGGGEHFLGWVERDGQMSDPMALLQLDEYTEIGLVPGRS